MEFAILAPVLILLLFGIIEFGVMIFNQQVITNASREAARFGIIFSDPKHTAAEIQQVVIDYCADHLVTFGDSSTALKTPTVTGAEGSFGSDLTVKVEYEYNFLFMDNFGFGTITLAAETVMKHE